MTQPVESPRTRPPMPTSSARALGWICGLGLVIVPWVGAGIVATLVTLTGIESLNAEQTYPWFLAASAVVYLGGLVYGSMRLPGFRRGAVLGALVAVVLTVTAFAAIYALQP